MTRLAGLLAITAAVGGCGGEEERKTGPTSADAAGPGLIEVPDAGGPPEQLDAAAPDLGRDDGGPQAARDCPDLFGQDQLVTYEIDIAADDWLQLRDEFLHFEARQLAGLPLHPYHRIGLRYGQESLEAWIRLKGRSSWFNAVRTQGDKAKMQFVIAFDQGADTKRRFHGVQKLELDHASFVDHTWLHERVSTWFLRKIGIPAACVNHARLVVNGTYYGLYSNLEHPDHDFLRRAFPGESDGDLWHKRDDLRWSKDLPDYAAHDRIWAAWTATEMAALTDMRATLRAWAVEALLPDADGYWGGNNNFMMYRHPSRGWMWLPDDLDGTLDFRPADMHPVFFWQGRVNRDPGHHFVAVISDPRWFSSYVEELEWALAGWDIAEMQSRVDAWAEQIAAAAAADPNVPYTFADHQSRIALLRKHIAERAELVRAWLKCAQHGGADADGDGVPWCTDCDEADPAVHMGAPEICGDGRDQSCNGVADDGC